MKKLFSLFLSLFMMTSLVACGSEKASEEPVKEEEIIEEEPVKTSEYFVENEIVRLEIGEPTTMKDVDVPVFNSVIKNLSDDVIYVQGREVQPGQTNTDIKFFYEPYDGEDVCYCLLDVQDLERNTISSINFIIGLDEDKKITSFEIDRNYAVPAALRNALKIEQITDSALEIDGKDECGETFHSQATLKITNTSDVTILINKNYDTGIVLKPGESVEYIAKDWKSACDATVELPFSVGIEYYEYNGSDIPGDYDFEKAAYISYKIKH